MITIKDKGDLFIEKGDIKVIPVNCIGVMGAGLALTFKDRFEKNDGTNDMMRMYKHFCGGRLVKTGDYVPITVKHPRLKTEERYLLFATKVTPGDISDMEKVYKGLRFFSDRYGDNLSALNLSPEGDKPHIIFPAIGCGLGKGNVDDLEEEMLKLFTGCRLRVLFIKNALRDHATAVRDSLSNK